MRKSAIVLVLAIVAALAVYAWSQHSARIEAERNLGLEASRVLSSRFSKEAALKVATLSGSVLARGEDEGFMGVVESEQTTAVPFTVDYFIDVSRIDGRSYRWDEQSKTLTVEIPDVAVAKPNIDESAAKTEQKGIFISRRAALELARQTSQRATARSAQAARSPEHMKQARENARAVVARMAQGPLEAAGLDDVRVAVNFPWEPKNPSAVPTEQWDSSRRMEDVLKERKEQAR